MEITEEEKATVNEESEELKQPTSEMEKKTSADVTSPRMKRQLNLTQEETQKEVFSTEQKATCGKRTRVETDKITGGHDENSSTMEGAEKVQRNLPAEFPSFTMSIRPSHLSRDFLHLPKKVRNQHLPKSDSIIILVDESGTAYETKYLVGRKGLRGGWRGFSNVHDLHVGNVLEFERIEATKFKVHIMRKNHSKEMSETSVNQEGKGMGENTEERPPELSVEAHQDIDDLDLGLVYEVSFDLGPLDGVPGDVLENAYPSGVPLETVLPKASLDFKEVKSFEDFSILVNGLVINYEFEKDELQCYYNLCCSQKTYLHEQQPDGLRHSMAVEMIKGTASIADEIKASCLMGFRRSCSLWSMTLKSYQQLRMNVGFLLARLDQLKWFDSVEDRLREAMLKLGSVDMKIRDLEESLQKAKDEKKKLNDEIAYLNSLDDQGNREAMYQQLASAPW